MKVLFDSSSLVLMFERKVDIFEALEEHVRTRIEGVVLSSVLKELSAMGKDGSMRARHARAAYQYVLEAIERKALKKLDVPSEYSLLDVDGQLVAIAQEMNIAIFTQDNGIMRRARKSRTKVYSMRSTGTIGEIHV